MIWATIIVGLVALERLGELVLARRNTRALLAQGAVEFGARHYKFIVTLHVVWLLAVFLRAPAAGPPEFFWLGVYVALTGARIWVLRTLGRYWTTRIISLPEAKLVRTGPYRFLNHPNYAVVIGEIAVLPLVFREWGVALVFSALNLAMLAWRVRVENRTLEGRSAGRLINSIL